MRFVRKAIILTLAAIGAQRVYELVSPRVRMINERAVINYRGVKEVSGITKDAVVDDMRDASRHITDDLTAGGEVLQEQVHSSMNGSRDPAFT